MDPRYDRGMFRLPRTATLLLGVVLGLYLWNLGAPELTDTDESRSGCIVRDMVEGGHWLLPRTPDRILCEKPPAYYAPTALVVKLFGQSDAAMRIVSVLAALGTLAVTAWLARLYGTARASWIAVVALASNLIFIRWARQAMVDMTLTFFMTAGLASYFAARLGVLKPRSAALAGGISFALAILSKGPSLFALPLGIIGADALLASRGKPWTLPVPWRWVGLALALVVLISFGWYWTGWRVGGMEFLRTCLFRENFGLPFGDAADTGTSHHKPLLYYFWNQPLFLLAMLPLLPAVAGWLLDKRSDPARRDLLTWIGVGFLLFLVASNKRHYYLLPLQPAFALLIALGADAAAEEGRRERFAWGTGIASGLLVLASGVGMYLISRPSHLERWAGPELIETMGARTGMLSTLAFLGIGVGVAGLVSLRTGIPGMLRTCARIGFLAVAGNSIVADEVAASLNPNQHFVAEALREGAGASAAVMPPFTTYGLHYYWPGPLPQNEAAARAARFVFVRRDKLNLVPSPVEEKAVRPYGKRDKDVLLVERR